MVRRAGVREACWARSSASASPTPGAGCSRFPNTRRERVGESVAGYARERSGLLATGDEGRAFAQQVGELASRVDALAARIDALASQAPDSVVAAKFAEEEAAPASDSVGVIEHREEVARGAGDDERCQTKWA